MPAIKFCIEAIYIGKAKSCNENWDQAIKMKKNYNRKIIIGKNVHLKWVKIKKFLSATITATPFPCKIS